MNPIATALRAKACDMELKRCALKPKVHRFCLNAHHSKCTSYRSHTMLYEHKSKLYGVHTTLFSDKMIVWREKGAEITITTLTAIEYHALDIGWDSTPFGVAAVCFHI